MPIISPIPIMTPDSTSRRFTPEEVQAILRRAVERQGAGATSMMSYGDLMETGRELGIDPAVLEAAMSELDSTGAIDEAREQFKAQKKQKFYEHLRSYVIINLMLFLLDYFVSGGTWFFWVLFGWGIGVLFDASDTFFPKDRDIERGARRIMEREARQRRRAKAQTDGKKSFTIDAKDGRLIIEKGDKRIEIG